MNPHNPKALGVMNPRKQFTTARRSAYERGYNRRWRRASRSYLRNHPQCAHCPCAATVVDHVTPHKGDYDLFWAASNWQPLCKPCHDTKTATHDGGFGREVTTAPTSPKLVPFNGMERQVIIDEQAHVSLGQWVAITRGIPNPQSEVS